MEKSYRSNHRGIACIRCFCRDVMRYRLKKQTSQKQREVMFFCIEGRREFSCCIVCIAEQRMDYTWWGINQTEIEGPLALSQVRGKMIAVRRNGKSFSTGNPLYVIFSRIWLILRPFRPVISQIIHKMHPFREAN